ncbi:MULTISPECIES: mannitol-1-phosphate 5-dehydrogenase [unclassified Leifsonia]|uniref:mannitol-1-phosphate 5-dehydrogenase n=1 Tax=unclassified Leifsonia TaxID=2663824 RepID=UPI0006F81116|nr:MULTISPECIES: mannitol-1-phosphate 5-dehydrogenase [unclassified Leifsonia]KQX07918.1 mannitol-1-phosphate 5-dehydrogenase [Leifsonia sp. Root1293]KRA12199.1 mannitol-1-phosphate 5-dehydrogenase [Leifsonia sp. Root60]
MKKAVHFGAGNIGRGFVGLILHDAGYEVVFADVNAELIDALSAASSYEVHEVGETPATRIVDHFRAINSATQEEELRSELTTAHIVTTAVGPTILRFIAPHIAAAMRERPAELPPLQVMACENAINATDLLRDEVASFMGQDEWRRNLHKAVFANTAVDRIVPGQDPDAGLDVTVESFFEWVIEDGPFEGDVPVIPDATFVADLLPFIERKLFTVNTGHATVAYLGAAAGYTKLSDALGDASVAEIATRVLQETSTLLVAKHQADPEVQRDYREKILRRFANPSLPDTVQRVGRQPLRKLSRHERFVGPAAELAERGLPTSALVEAIGAALAFDDPDDEQSVQMHALLAAAESPDEFVESVMGIDSGHPLFQDLREIVAARR